jgi:type VI protein secretion system component VasK
VRSASEASREIGIKESSVAASFISTDEAATTASLLQRLLTQPGARTLSLVTELPKAEMNADARNFCEAFRPLANTFPFVPGGADAPVRTVTAIFQKGDGALWSLYQRRLQPYFTTAGALRSPVPRGDRVTTEFSRFFARAADFSNALYTDTDGPVMSFHFRPYIFPTGSSSIVLDVNGTTYTFTPQARASQQITWRPDASRPVRLIVRSGNTELHSVVGQGEWAVFRIFAGTVWREASGWQRVVWRIPQRSDSVVADITDAVLDAKPVLRPDFLRDLAACPPRILN